MDDKSLLELCLKVSGAFEDADGAPYDAVTGNEDGEGLSIGCLQWNAGQGTMQPLLIAIGTAMGWDKAQSYFQSDIHQLAISKPADAVAFCLDHYIVEGGTHVDPTAKAAWVAFLSQPESIQAQVDLASKTVLSHAKRLVASYCPDYINRQRPYAFMFDVCTQEGGMASGHTVVPPQPSGTTPDVSDVIAFATINDARCSGIWQANMAGDNLSSLLLRYAYDRAKLARPQYVWDATSRRGTIACRAGIVHKGKIDLHSLLD